MTNESDVGRDAKLHDPLDDDPDWGLLLSDTVMQAIREQTGRLPLSSAFEEAELFKSMWSKGNRPERAVLLRLLASDRENIRRQAIQEVTRRRVGRGNAVWRTPELRAAIIEADDKIKAQGGVKRSSEVRLIYNELNIPGNPDDTDVKKYIRSILEQTGRRTPRPKKGGT